MRRAARRDESEPAIVEALEAVGATVQRLSVAGVPDLLVGWGGAMWLLEVKLPLTARGAIPRGRGLKHKGGREDMTADQIAWWSAWHGPSPVIVRTPEEALTAIGALPSDENLIAKVMRTTGATRSEAELALVAGRRLADQLIGAYSRASSDLPTPVTRPAPDRPARPAEAQAMTPKQIAEIVTAAALATLRQLAGVDQAELEHAARAIGNNAAQALALSDEDLTAPAPTS